MACLPAATDCLWSLGLRRAKAGQISLQVWTLLKKLEAASALCNLLINVHGRDFAHGDLHPGNILVCPNQADELLSLIFIDALDFGDTSDPYNVEYGPINPASTDSFGRDCYAVYQIVEELLGRKLPRP